jgi:type IV pilus assembly protein PilE
MQQRMRGVTLIELMIVVVVLAIIASISIPSYRGYMLRAHRSDATAALLRIRVAQEKFFLQNNAYTNELGPAGLRLRPDAGTSMTTENGYYTVDFQAQTANSYTARATAIGGQTRDTDCTVFTITDQGMRATSPGTLANCWR